MWNKVAERDSTRTQPRAAAGGTPPIGMQLEDFETFLARIQHLYSDETIDRDLYSDAYSLLDNPPRMPAVIVSHLHTMWEELLAPEWARHEPDLQRTVDAYRDQNYAGLTVYEAIERITGRDLRGSWQYVLRRAQHLIFTPSPHRRPYLVKFAHGPLVRIVFGARLPAARPKAGRNLPQAELLIRLRALADETRLRIIELVLEHKELCAQEVITRLDLSQSSASRHLSQLSATGFLIEWQREGKTKCYRINPNRFKETLRAIASFGHIDL